MPRRRKRSPQHGRTSTLRNGKNRDPLRTLRRLDAVSVALCSVLDPAALCVAAHDCADCARPRRAQQQGSRL